MKFGNLPPEVIETLKKFIDEDVRSGDITTELTVSEETTALATIYAKERTVLAGIEEVAAIAEFSGLDYEVLAFEGNWVDPQTPVMRLKGSARTSCRRPRSPT